MVSTDLTSPKSNPKSDSSKSKALEAIVAIGKQQNGDVGAGEWGPWLHANFVLLIVYFNTSLELTAAAEKFEFKYIH